MNCAYCAKDFNSARLLVEHRKTCFSTNGYSTYFSDTQFHCDLCDELFFLRLDFVWHLESHLRSKVLSIRQEHEVAIILHTIKRCRSENKLSEVSIKTANLGISLRSCKPCKIEFEDAKAFNLHQRLCHSFDKSNLNHIVSVFKCDACRRNFENLDVLENHSCVSHPVDVKHQFDLPEMFSPVQVVIPRDAKGDVRPAELCFETSEIYPRYLCLLCNMAVLTPQMAHYHLLRHQPDHCVPLATNVCPVCLSTVANREELVMHLHSLHSVAESANIEKKQSDFTCEVCGSVLTSFVFYENHMVRIHNFKEGKYCKYIRCTDCKKRFRDTRGIRLHRKYKKCSSWANKKEVKASPMECVYCGSGFPNALTLGKHVKRKHRIYIKGKKYMCCESGCYKLFSGYGNLARHHRTSHLPPKNICSFCRKSFDCIDDFHLHVVKHTLPKFQCPICPKVINGPGSCLRAHLNNYHRQGLRCYRKLVSSSVKWGLKRCRSPREQQSIDHGVQCSKCLQLFESKNALLRHSFKEHSCAFPKLGVQNSNNLPLHISFLSPKSVEVVDSVKTVASSNNTGSQTENVSNSIITENSPLDSLSLFGTLKLAGVDLPVYQLTPGQFEQLQLDDTESLVSTSFTFSH